jgi:hypothetical protein
MEVSKSAEKVLVITDADYDGSFWRAIGNGSGICGRTLHLHAFLKA